MLQSSGAGDPDLTVDPLATQTLAERDDAQGEEESLVAAAIVAEATAIARAAEADLVAQRQTSVRLAANTAQDAAAKAAHTVARAAERARLAQEIAVTRAADDVATSAAASAVEMQRRADEIASILLIANLGMEPSTPAGSPPAASSQQVRVAAEQSEHTAQAARVVAAMVASSAQSVAVTAAALAATTAMQVSLAAKAVQAVTDSAAREVQTVNNDESLRAADRAAEGGSTQNALQRVVDHQIAAWRSAKERETVGSDLLATVRHELKTPLTCVRAYLDLFMLDPPPMTDDQKMYVEIALKNVGRIDSLITNLQPIGGSQYSPLVAKNDVDLDDLLASAIDSIQPDIQRNAQRFVTRLDHRAAVLRADYDQLHRALINLLTNASKYTPRQGVIEFSSLTDHTGVHISITDTGPGISLVDQDRLFERSFRAGQALAGAIEGSGLGLVIVNHIVTDHDGTICVRSELGHGSTFTMSLPVRIVIRPTDRYDDRRATRAA